jgi:hypothetical protein
VVVIGGTHQPLGLFDEIEQRLGRAHFLVDGGPYGRVVDGGVEEDQRQLAEEGHLLVGGPRGPFAVLVELAPGPRVGVAQAGVEEVYDLVGKFGMRLGEEGDQHWVAALGGEAPEGLVGVPATEAGQEAQSIRIDPGDVEAVGAEVAQEVELL